MKEGARNGCEVQERILTTKSLRWQPWKERWSSLAASLASNGEDHGEASRLSNWEPARA